MNDSALAVLQSMYLNCHSYFSFKFGTLSQEALLKEASSKGVRKLVLTDVNNTSGVLDFIRRASHYNVLPVVGIDFRKRVQQQFIGIAKNNEGFRELNDFLSKCLREGETGLTGREAMIPDRPPGFEHAFVIYPFSTITAHPYPTPLSPKGEVLTHQPRWGSPGTCPDFFVGRELEGSASNLPLKENEFIGIKPSDLNRLRFSEWKYHPEKLVVLAPVTFRDKIDFNSHRLLRAMDNNIVLSKLPLSEQAAADEIMIHEEALCALYQDFPQIIRNTQFLLEQCEPVDFEFGENKNKRFFKETLVQDRELLLKLCEEGMAHRYPESDDVIKRRFEKEIDLITQKEFTSYFLINHDIVNYARHKNYFYVGRGSGANSIVAYLLHITDVDPIDLDLYFERFINPSRKNPPDFDIDFSWDDRDDVIDYIFYRSPYGEKYKNQVALLATYSEMKDNSVVRELGKVFGLPKAEIDALLDDKNHPGTPDHISRLIHQYGNHLYSFPSHLSIHAGGILISEKPITYYTALSNPPKGFPLTQFSMLEAEDVGFAKFDILSQRGLGKMKDAVEIIKQNRNEDIDIHAVQRFKTDERIREHLQQAKLMGCFYVESPAMRMLLTKLRASTYLDLVAASSIIRPGVAQSGMMQEYIRRFHDPSRRQYAHPLMKELMEETFGIMVYQEDVIKVAHHFGKLSLGEADRLRRGMGGKYKGRQEFQEVRDIFFSNCRKEGYDEKLIHEVWYQMETFGGYAFSKGHSASYAVESYQCMFLKVYYPHEFMVAVINNGGGFFSTEFYVHEARMCGAKIHAPHINKSEFLTTIYGEDIYLGLHLMADLEKNVSEKILEERRLNGDFSSLQNFISRVSISVDQLRILIRIGCFRFTGRTKKQLMWDVHTVLGDKKKSSARKELFESGYKNFRLPELFSDPFDDARDQIEILGFPLCSPFELIAPPTSPKGRLPLAHGSQDVEKDMRQQVSSSRRFRGAADLPKYKNQIIEIIGYYVTYKPTSTKKGEFMMFGCFLDRNGYFFDTNHFPEAAKRFPFHGKGCYLIKGKVAEEFGFYSINVIEMHRLDYIMYESDADTVARSKPDPVAETVVVSASKKYEYLLVITPPPHVRNEVEALKKKFHQHFNHYQAVASKPHITLSSFILSETQEEEVVKKIISVTSLQSSFRITLKNFDRFKTHTIYIGVEEPDDVIGLVKKLKKELHLHEKESFFSIKPHLTLAKGLDIEKFSVAFPLFQPLAFKHSFVVSSIVFLRREEKFSKYEVVKEFGLTNVRFRHNEFSAVGDGTNS